MSNQQAKRDDNWLPVIQGETNDASRETRSVLVDPVTGRVLVETTGTVTISGSTTTDTKFNTNHIDDYTTTSVTYIGKEDSSGVWKIVKIDETGNFPVFTYASVTNNASLTTYALAWAARTTATYNVYSTAF